MAIKEDYKNVLDELTTDKVEIKVINQYEDIKKQLESIRGNEEAHTVIIKDLMDIVNDEFLKMENRNLSDEDMEKHRENSVKRILEMKKKIGGKIDIKDKISDE